MTVGPDDLVLISYTIKKDTDQNQRSASDLTNDFDTLIKAKSITPIGMNNSTKILDETYGFQPTREYSIMVHFIDNHFTDINFIENQ